MNVYPLRLWALLSKCCKSYMQNAVWPWILAYLVLNNMHIACCPSHMMFVGCHIYDSLRAPCFFKQIFATFCLSRNTLWLTTLHGSRSHASSEVWCKGQRSFYLVSLISSTVSHSWRSVDDQFLTEQADLWSVGVILYQLVTGYPPFNGDNQIQVCLLVV